MYTERKIIVSKSDMIIRGSNARGRKNKKIVIDINDTRALPKRPKQRSFIRKPEAAKKKKDKSKTIKNKSKMDI